MTVTKNRIEALGAEDMTEYDPDTDPRETAGGNDVPKQVQPLGEAPWLLQVSLKTPAGSLINIRGMSKLDIGLGLEDIADLAHEISETESLFGAHAALAPVRPQPVQAPQQPQQGQPWTQGGGAAPQNAPMCDHGMPAKFVQGGISKSTGRPYRAFWACALPREQQCKFRQDG